MKLKITKDRSAQCQMKPLLIAYARVMKTLSPLSHEERVRVLTAAAIFVKSKK